jgi:hypothetical protein
MRNNMTRFGGRECANILHALARAFRRPYEPSLLPALKQQVQNDQENKK